MTRCNQYRDLIPRALLDDLGNEERRLLELHVAECAACAQEQALFANTIQQLATAGDVPVPRHFFVYPEKGRHLLWQGFQRLAFGWKAAFAALLITLAVLAVANLQVKTGKGGLTLTIGRTAETETVPAIDVSALKAELLQQIDARFRQEQVQQIKVLRDELARSDRNSELTRQQKRLLASALAELEARVSEHVLRTGVTLQAGVDRSLAEMYQAVQVQRRRDQSMIERLERVVFEGEMKDKETDAILDTLLQVAELRVRN